MKTSTIQSESIEDENTIKNSVELEVKKQDVEEELNDFNTESRKSFRRLTSEMVFNEDQALDVVKMTSEERLEKAEDYKKQIRIYRNLMYVVSLNSGWFSYTSGLVQFALLFILKVSGAENASFVTFINIPWCLKPLFGFLSDNFAILGYR